MVEGESGKWQFCSADNYPVPLPFFVNRTSTNGFRRLRGERLFWPWWNITAKRKKRRSRFPTGIDKNRGNKTRWMPLRTFEPEDTFERLPFRLRFHACFEISSGYIGLFSRLVIYLRTNSHDYKGNGSDRYHAIRIMFKTATKYKFSYMVVLNTLQLNTKNT